MFQTIHEKISLGCCSRLFAIIENVQILYLILRRLMEFFYAKSQPQFIPSSNLMLVVDFMAFCIRQDDVSPHFVSEADFYSVLLFASYGICMLFERVLMWSVFQSSLWTLSAHDHGLPVGQSLFSLSIEFLYYWRCDQVIASTFDPINHESYTLILIEVYIAKL